jgi:hypothetical protein
MFFPALLFFFSEEGGSFSGLHFSLIPLFLVGFWVSWGKSGRDSGWFLGGLGMSNGRFGHEMGVFRVKNLHEIKTVLPIFASQFSSLRGRVRLNACGSLG